MSIIKNLITRNKLRKELYIIEESLRTSGYYEKEKQLFKYIRKPDEYAEMYLQIQAQYGELVNQKNTITTKLRKLSGIDLLKKQSDEYTK